MRLLFLGLMASCILFIFPGQALAYIDPASDSLILQVLAAVLICIVIFAKPLRRRIAELFGQKNDEAKDEAANK